MRSKKLKLAAVVLSAIMAAGTPSMAFAEDFAAVDEQVALDAEELDEAVQVLQAEVDGQQSVGYQVDPASVKFHYNEEGEGALPDFTVTYTEVAQDGSGRQYDEKTTASVLKQSEATCTDPAYVWMTVTIDGFPFNSGETDKVETAFVIKDSKALGHVWVEQDRYGTKYPSCTEDGGGFAVFKCSRCGEEEERIISDKLEATGHKWGDTKVRYYGFDNVKEDRETLIDETRDGYYYKETYQTCVNRNRQLEGAPICGEENILKTELVVVYAKKVVSAEITDQKDIKDDLIGLSMEDFRKAYPKDTDIELKKCTVAGKYQVTYFNAGGQPVSQKWFDVAAHHMEVKTIEYNTEKDAQQCTIDPKTGRVINLSCYLPIKYYETIHCTAEGCPNDPCHKANQKNEYTVCNNLGLKLVSKTEKTAQPEGDHIINKEVEKIVLVEAEKKYADADKLAELAKDKASYIKFTNSATCTEDGKGTVVFLCKLCNAEVKKVELNTKALGHNPLPAVGEEQVKPSCDHLGSYDAVIYCERCGAELERRKGVKIPRIKHTNEISVDTNGIGVDDTTTDKTAYIKFIGDKVVDWDGYLLTASAKEQEWDSIIGGWTNDDSRKSELAVQAYAYTNCDVCANHEVELDNDEVVLTIVDVTKQKEDGEAGSITLKATYTKNDGTKIVKTESFDYYSTVEAYQSRTVKAPINGLHKDDDGVYRYYKNSVLQSDFTGIVEYNGGEFFVAKGVLCSEANGLNEYNGKWYYLSAGQIQRGYNGLALYDGEWFYLNNGELNATVNGLVPYDGGTFLFAEGRLVKEHNGLWQNFDGKWYFLALGQVQNQHTGVAEYDGSFFYVRAGQLAADYNGTVDYDGHTFNVVAGQLYDQVA